jgi:hypothetical protein
MRPDHSPAVARAISPIVLSRGAAVATFLLIALFVAFTLAGAGATELLYRVLVDGTTLIAWLCAGYGIGAVVVPRMRVLDDAPVALRWSVCAALGLGAVGLLVLMFGLARLLNRPSVVVLIGVGDLLALWQTRVWLRAEGRAELARRVREPARWHWLWVLAAPVFGLLIIAALVPPGVLWGDEPNGYDVVEYHLQIPREWYEAGRISPLRHNVFSYFPMGMETHYLLAMHLRGGPWAGAYLAQLMHATMAALTVLAVYGVVRWRMTSIDGAEPTGALPVIAGVLVATTPWLSLLAPVAYNECALLLYATLAIGILLRASHATGSRDATRRGTLAAIAGVFAGLACGAKLTAIPTLVLSPAVVVIVAQLLNRSLSRRTLAPVAIYIVTGLVVSSPWLIRTALWTGGNPIFPESATLLGKAHWTDDQVERWHQANHLPAKDSRTMPARFATLWRQVIADYEVNSDGQLHPTGRYGYVLLPLALVASLASSRQSQTARALAILLILILLQWTFLSHLQSRFLTPIIPVAAMLVAEVGSRTWTRLTVAATIISAAWCFYAIGGKFLAIDRRVGGIGAALGLENPAALVGVDLSSIPSDSPVVLVGDARSFLYPIPMSRLSYTTVFDVLPPTGNTPDLTAWRAIDQPTTPPSTTTYVVDPSEWRRLSRTYWHVPPPPPDVAERSEPFVTTR